MTMSGTLAALALVGSSALSAVGGVVLPDQRGGSDSLDAHRGHAVLVLVVDARRLGTVRRWERDLLTRFPQLHVLTVADVHESRPTSLERVAEVLSRRVPPEVAVLIDMQRRWALELELDTAAPNLLLVAPDGTLAGRWRGRWSEALAEEVAAGIARLGGSA